MAETQTRKQKVLHDVQKARRTRTIISIVVIAIIAVGVVGGVLLLRGTPPNPLIGVQISSTTQNQLAGVSDSTLVQVKHSGVTQLTTETGTLLNSSGGLPEVLYIGADYCPYCAAERWSIIVALEKFGNFTGLTYMQSADAPEIYPDTSTFSFHNAHYTSSYISFVGVETYDRNKQPLDPISSSQQAILNQYDPGGSIPFVDVANKAVTYNGGSQFQPSAIAGLDWNTIGSQLNNPNSGTAKAVDAAANTMITAICNVDGSVPNSVCSLNLSPPSQLPPATNNIQSPNVLNTLIATDAYSVMDRLPY
jgi:uncharacterized protein DUF929